LSILADSLGETLDKGVGLSFGDKEGKVEGLVETLGKAVGDRLGEAVGDRLSVIVLEAETLGKEVGSSDGAPVCAATDRELLLDKMKIDRMTQW